MAFDEAGAEAHVRLVYVEPTAEVPPDCPESAAEYQTVIRQLEHDLTETREDLQTSIEEFQTGNKEFKAAHEEVSSINEELQSTNEELETSKEELQSLNEEIQTVNSQLEIKVAELESVNNDLYNLLASIDHATLFLDRHLCIRRFTPATRRLLPIVDTDVGRPFGDFSTSLTDDDLLTDADNVLRHLTPIDKEVQSVRGLREAPSQAAEPAATSTTAETDLRTVHPRWYVRRIVPYRTEDHRIDGVVITFTDITARKLAEMKLEALNNTLGDEVHLRTELLQLVHDITANANKSRSIDQALTYAVERICHYNGWHAGRAYRRADDGSNNLVPTNIWYAGEGKDLSRLKYATGATRHSASDAGPVSFVLRTAELQWVEDITRSTNDDNDACDCGMRALIALPVLQRTSRSAPYWSFTRKSPWPVTNG